MKKTTETKKTNILKRKIYNLFMNEKHSVNKNKFLKKTLFSFMLFLPICLASVASCYTFEYKIDYFSYQLVDYKKINHSNNYHPVIMNISKDNETNEYVSFNSLFSHFSVKR